MRAPSPDRVVGQVVGVWRYPVKSMGPEPLGDVHVSWHGLAGDRRWAFVLNRKATSGFPWLTLRDRAEMSQYYPSFVDPAHPESSQTVVRTPADAVFDVADPALANELSPGGVHVLRQGRGAFDTFPLSLITTQTVRQLAEIVGQPLAVERFRPNILVQGSEDSPFPEDEWVGSVLRVGGMRMRVDKRDGRCVVIAIDPQSHERDLRILRAVRRERDGCLGVYGSTVEPGRVSLGDDVILERPV